jgi:hypothetical protein
MSEDNLIIWKKSSYSEADLKDSESGFFLHKNLNRSRNFNMSYISVEFSEWIEYFPPFPLKKKNKVLPWETPIQSYPLFRLGLVGRARRKDAEISHLPSQSVSFVSLVSTFFPLRFFRSENKKRGRSRVRERKSNPSTGERYAGLARAFNAQTSNPNNKK